MSELTIRATGLWKQYRIGAPEARPDTFREAVMGALTASARRWRRRNGEDPSQHIWALRDVGFEIRRGDAVGIIGRNGAGKTTLLKILSRVTAPTRGRIEFRGRLASLLEVGTGFHPELTGRENIFVNGAILGMPRHDIRRRLDEIVAFAEVERFLDTPVKRYSSGMAVRLAFSIAAHLDPDVLLVDEVLAVGDRRFQRRCLGKLSEAGREGRTVLFVSHSLGAVSKLCARGIVLAEGRIAVDGSVTEAVASYARDLNNDNGWGRADFSGPMGDKLEFRGVWINGQDAKTSVAVRPSEPLVIRIRGEALEEVCGYRSTVSIVRDGQVLINRFDAVHPATLHPGEFESEFTLPAHFLSPGLYSVNFGGYSVDKGAWTWSRDQLPFVVIDEWSADYDTLAMGLVNLPPSGRRWQLDVTRDS